MRRRVEEFNEWLQDRNTKIFRDSLIRKREEAKEELIMRMESKIEQLAICQIELRTEARILQELINFLTPNKGDI